MGIISKPNTFSAGATIIASEHNDNFDTVINDYNGNITNTNIAAGAAIVDTKLAQITTAAKVHGSSLTGLASINTATAGTIPSALIPAINLAGTGTGGITGILPGASIDTGTTAGKIVALNAFSQLPAVSGALLTNISKENLGIDSGSASAPQGTNAVSFNFTFSSAPIVILTKLYNADGAGYDDYVKTTSTTGFTFYHDNSTTMTCNWIAIGTKA
jgi:hypothetical protein